MSEIKMLYVSTAVTKDVFNKIRINKIEGTSNGFVPIFKYHNAIIKGIRDTKKIDIESLIVPPITNATSKIKKISDSITFEDGIKFNTIGFYNIKLIKYLTIFFKLPNRVYSWYRANKNKEKIIIIDGSFISGIIPLYILNMFLKVPIIYIIADVYDFMNPNTKNSSLSKYFYSKSFKDIHGLIVITEQTNELINTNHKPHLVVEGIVNSGFIPLSKNTDQNRFCMYAGSLDKQNGIGDLIEAYIKIKTNFDLKIYGSGNLERKIKEYSKKYPQIKYMGVLGIEDIIIEETKASYLINPRPIDKEFVKYSFPSKIIEYLLSGTPVISSHLPGIPEEYDQYINYLDITSKESFITSLSAILNDENQVEYEEKAARAKKWVAEQKSAASIGNKIAEFIEMILINKTSDS